MKFVRPLKVGSALIALVVMVLAVAGVLTAVDDDGDRDAGRPARTMTPEERAAFYLPGPVWDPGKVPHESWSQAEQFNEFPLLWLGVTFDRFNLRSIRRVTSETNDSLTFAYGRCADPPCHVPLTVQVRHVCFWRPEDFAPRAIQIPLTPVRGGAQMLGLGEDALVLWTGGVSVRIGIAGEHAGCRLPTGGSMRAEMLSPRGTRPAHLLRCLLPQPSIR